MPELLDDILAYKTVRDYVCSNCWGHLLYFPVGMKWRIECHNCGEHTVGFVTKYYTQKRLGDSLGELIDARPMLQDLGIIQNPHEDKTVEELLREMGF